MLPLRKGSLASSLPMAKAITLKNHSNTNAIFIMISLGFFLSHTKFSQNIRYICQRCELLNALNTHLHLVEDQVFDYVK